MPSDGPTWYSDLNKKKEKNKRNKFDIDIYCRIIQISKLLPHWAGITSAFVPANWIPA